VGAAAFVTRIRAILLRNTGATLSPFHGFLFLQGLETLSLRVERHVENALKVVIHPASTTHSQMNEAELLEQGIRPGTIRLSIGTEHIDDILEDLEEAFRSIL